MEENTIIEDKEIKEKIDELKSEIKKADNELKMKIVDTSINDETGETIIGKEIDSSEKDIDKSIDELLEEELDNFANGEEINFEELKDVINSEKDPKDPFNISDSATLQLLNVINKYKKDKKINLYKEFPDEIKKMIDKSVIDMEIPIMSNEGKRMRNTASLLLVDEYLKSIEMNRIMQEYNDGLKNVIDESKGDLADAIVAYTKERNEKYREAIDNIEDEDKKKKAKEIFDIIDTVKELKELKEFSKKCKIKSIELDKPKRVFGYIMNKYENSKMNIYDINMCIPILYRKLNEDCEEGKEEYSKKDVLAFLIAFSKQCINYKVEEPKEHAYMYYVLYNIVLMDINKGDHKEISEEFKNNIKEVISNLRKRNSGVL